MELSKTEQEIIKIIREFNPYERVEIIKDQSGKPDYYIVHKSQKIVLQSKKNMI